MNAYDMNINMSGNPADLTDEEAEAMYEAELRALSASLGRYVVTGEQ